MTGVARRRAALAALAAAVVMMVSAVSWAAPVVPTPVRNDPAVAESAPSSYGALFGWAQGSRAPGHLDYFVQRGTNARIKVNAPGTRAPSGGVLQRSVVYVQQKGARRPQLYVFDLRSRRRAPLPPAVNDATYRRTPIRIVGDVSASGPWVLFLGEVPVADYYPRELVLLYNRVTRKLRVLATSDAGAAIVRVGQVNGSYATYSYLGRYGATSVTRHDIRTGRTTSIRYLGEETPEGEPDIRVSDPAVGADGTLYYVRRTSDPAEPGQPSTTRRELVRHPIGGSPQVVGTFDGGRTFVRGRADGSTLVFYERGGDIYRIVDRPSAG